jgi:hypothetical protein
VTASPADLTAISDIESPLRAAQKSRSIAAAIKACRAKLAISQDFFVRPRQSMNVPPAPAQVAKTFLCRFSAGLASLLLAQASRSLPKRQRSESEAPANCDVDDAP